MIAYHEWIRFGHDPVYAKDFYALTRAEAQAFATKVIEAMPERIQQLTEFVQYRRPRQGWTPDFTDGSFQVLVEVLHESVEKIPRSNAEVEKVRDGRSDILNIIDEPIWRWKVTDRTISLAFDAALYFGNDLIDKEDRMIWRLEERLNANRFQPIVRAPSKINKPPYLCVAPFDLFRSHVFRIANGDPHVYSLEQIRHHWMQNISRYKLLQR
ncbi:MAG: hypothetical protein KF743_14340 [Fimbriimonadaceae bacterium]|nr:hypothetical protein [Fimbriimonadaceae bacterium]